MTSAARPTWLPAMGGHTGRDLNNTVQLQVSNVDLPQHKKMKLRQSGQNAPDDLKVLDLKRKLKEAEEAYYNKSRKKKSILEQTQQELREDALVGISLSEEAKRRAIELSADNPDADESSEEEEDSEQESSLSEESSDDEDDTEELMRELEKIKKERAEEKERQERERLEAEAKQREEEALTGNPLLQSSNKDFSVKRRWDDDVVFKNQAKGMDDKPKKRFINDLLRSDFHKKFMSKYVK